MRLVVDAKEALSSNGSVTTIYEVEETPPADSPSGFGGMPSASKRFELADGLKLTMVGHGEYKSDHTGEVYLVKAETLPAGTT